MPVALLRRRMAVWLQQGVLREEPAGTFSVVEEERPQDRDSMVLIDSDEESDSGMASQADQKEEELLVRRAEGGGRGCRRWVWRGAGPRAVGGAAGGGCGCGRGRGRQPRPPTDAALAPSSSGRTSRPC